MRNILLSFAILLSASSCANIEVPDNIIVGSQSSVQSTGAISISAQRTIWQYIEMDMQGPLLSEAPETFLNNRMDVTFTHVKSNQNFTVPSYFAADGRAAHSSETSGNIWRTRFTPNQTGEWRYKISFRRGTDVAIASNQDAGEAATQFDGLTGNFLVTENSEALPSLSFAHKGRITHRNSHYLKHANGDIFFKTGAGSPENIFAFADIDGTFDNGGTQFPALGSNQLHKFKSHIADWKDGDPVWQDDKGKALIGAVNYLSSVGVNAQYFVAMNVEGDGQDVWPWTGPENMYIFDVSKLDQWQIVMDHMDNRGIAKDFLFHETENESLLEQKEGGVFFAKARKLYYREMIARFGHNLGITWNLGEESGVIGNSGASPWRDPTTADQHKAFIEYIATLDAYDNPIVVHNWPDGEDMLYGPLLGNANFAGISMQAHENYADRIVKWRKASADAGHKWLIAVDEPLGWEFGARPDDQAVNHDLARTTVLWPIIMAGGSGVDWYFGWQNNAPTSDLSNENMRSRHNLWLQSKAARDLITDILPLDLMRPRPDLGDNVLAHANEIYALYSPDSMPRSINLAEMKGPLSLVEYDPKTGAKLSSNDMIGGKKILLTPSKESVDNEDRLFIIRK